MKRLILSLLVLLAAASPALATKWAIDPDHSNAQFKVKHMMIATVRGDFPEVTGMVHLDDKDLTRSVVNVSIATATLDTGVEKRDQHLKSPDFFEVAKFPAMTFKSTSVKKKGNGSLAVTGDLTIRDITRSVILEVEGPSQEIVDPWGNTRIAAEAVTMVNRQDFGLTWNKTLDGGGIVISDEVRIALEIELIKQK